MQINKSEKLTKGEDTNIQSSSISSKSTATDLHSDSNKSLTEEDMQGSLFKNFSITKMEKPEFLGKDSFEDERQEENLVLKVIPLKEI